MFSGEKLGSNQSDPLHPPPLDYDLYSPSFHLYGFSSDSATFAGSTGVVDRSPQCGPPPCGARNDVPELRRERVASHR